jgi:subtilisin family serine protease
MELNLPKLDMGLISIYSNYLQIKDKINLKGVWIHPALKSGNRDIYLTLQYQGDLKDIEESGFSTQSVEREGVANGIINIDILPNLSNHPSVIKLSYGEEFNLALKTSALEIFARGSVPVKNCVWKLDQENRVFTGMTGANVIVGIIDTGIEWRHLNFMTTSKTAFSEETRILSIWDQGLVPIPGERSPNVALLTGGPTYGVEYTKEMIDADIAFLTGVSDNPPQIRIRHKDSDGHGTHVAGIAAGNGRQPHKKSDTPFKYAGIAPEAKLVIVNHVELQNPPPAHLVNPLKQFKDAITYILRIADRGGVSIPGQQKQPLPAVINCSFGTEVGPHDGLGDDQEFLELQFDREPGGIGRICVFLTGNSSGHRQHAVATIPNTGSVEIPFKLYDKRTLKKDTKPLWLDFWYRNNVVNMQMEFKTPDTNAYRGPVVINGNLTEPFDVNKQFTIWHYSETITTTIPQLTRKRILVQVKPHADLHRTEGLYWVRLRNAPANSVIHVWCSHETGYGFKLDDSIYMTVPIRVTDDNTMWNPGDTLSVITVAAYDHHVKDGDNDGGNDDNRRMYCFSSKGPLVDYSGSGVIANKPDISAPGVNILSANSYQKNNKDTYGKSKHLRTDYVPMSGTSMAAPHITGVVALMLQKKGNQTVGDIKSVLNSAARAKPNGYPDLHPCDVPVEGVLLQAKPKEAGSGKVDAKTTCKNITP